MKDFSYITNSHPAFIEDLYKQYKQNANEVDSEYRKFFEGFDFALSQHTNAQSENESTVQLDKEFSVYRLIADYKKKGHLLSDTNPIRPRKDRNPQLELSYFGLSEADLTSKFYAAKYIGLPYASLGEVLSKLKKIYCAKVGIEYTYIKDQFKVEWLERAMEEEFKSELPIEDKRRIAQKLTEAGIFETFLHKKYVGQKRFSLEGGENTITLLDQIINTASQEGVKEAVLGMAHRGRLNVLATILGKTYEQIFSEFEGITPTDSTMGSGDVKYHMGFSSELKTASGNDIYLKLAPNPSHLETVGAVVMGYTRSKAALVYETNMNKIVPIVIHGDASVAGQGIIYELLQMSKLEGYKVGGTIHVVINNQIGFTTDFHDARSSDYCTSIAATIMAPVFHVNGDDAEAVAHVARIAARYRQQFKEDIFIDILCYRKYGHNEGDDPKYTQPMLYKLIDGHKSPRELYIEFLSSQSNREAELAKSMEAEFWNNLQERLDNIKQKPLPYTLQRYEKRWSGLRKATPEDFFSSPDTCIDKKTLDKLVHHLLHPHKDFTPLPKIKNLLDEKAKVFTTEKKLDWSTAELLAYISLNNEGHIVRLSGQDVGRGTFSHRHAHISSAEGETYDRINSLDGLRANTLIRNSLLSEYAVLGFEYGFSISTPNALVMWEAQFGDFVNGAQIVVDQYISSAEEKWGISSGLTLLLPHGYEGQGPEHSSARLERMLQLCAEYNMFVTNVTTAANFFHLLRRQLKLPFRKPLINFSPKANLRHPASYSTIEEFTKGGFQEIITNNSIDNKKVKKVIVCSGKIYFELQEYTTAQKISDVAVVRLEQLYPFPAKQWAAIRQQFQQATAWIWVQEEPKNMGAYAYLKEVWEQEKITFVSRPASAATATGFYKKHHYEQQQIIQQAFNV